MKAEERHHLKENELAEIIHDFPQWWQRYGQQILTGVIVVVVILAGGWWYRSYRAGQLLEQQEAVQHNLVNLDVMQSNAVSSAQQKLSAETEEQAMSFYSFNSSTVASDLELLAEGGTSATGIAALIGEAQAYRAELLYADMVPTTQRKAELIGQAKAAYETLLGKYPNSATAQGVGQMGLGLLAEEQGEWDKAREIYQEIVAQQDGKLAGTVFPGQAQERLILLDDIDRDIQFVAAASVTNEVPDDTVVMPTEEMDLSSSEVSEPN